MLFKSFDSDSENRSCDDDDGLYAIYLLYALLGRANQNRVSIDYKNPKVLLAANLGDAHCQRVMVRSLSAELKSRAEFMNLISSLDAK